jgi:regulator of protease activity HflC (stomatin/prohibitin superfamily)
MLPAWPMLRTSGEPGRLDGAEFPRRRTRRERASMFGLYVVKQYERGVQFRLGRVREGVRGPGMFFVMPLVNRVHRVSMRIVTLPIESQGIITRDNVSVGVSAVAY